MNAVLAFKNTTHYGRRICRSGGHYSYSVQSLFIPLFGSKRIFGTTLVCNFEVNVQRFTCWVLTEFKLKSSMSSSASILSPGITMFSFNLSLSFLFSFEASFFFLAKEAKAKLIQASSFSL